jgi:hypothetical protein
MQREDQTLQLARHGGMLIVYALIKKELRLLENFDIRVALKNMKNI